MNPQRLSLSFSSTSYKYRFVQGFIRALKRINRQKLATSPFSRSSPREICKRYLKVKSAADASMASAVGLRRAWSRALLQRIRDQERINFGNKYYKYCPAGTRIRGKSTTFTRIRNIKRSSDVRNYKDQESINNGALGWKANELRKLVPGGEAMDVCNLLDETAHYIKCLATQVKLMKRIADFASA